LAQRLNRHFPAIRKELLQFWAQKEQVKERNPLGFVTFAVRVPLISYSPQKSSDPGEEGHGMTWKKILI